MYGAGCDEASLTGVLSTPILALLVIGATKELRLTLSGTALLVV